MAGSAVITQAKLWCQKAASHQSRGNSTEAQNLLEKAIAVFRKEKDEEDLASSLSQLSQVYFHMNNWKAVTKPLLESAEIRTRLKDYRGLSIDYQMIGNLFMRVGDLDRAESWFFDSLGLAVGIDDNSLMATALSNLGSVNYRNGKLDRAKKFLTKSQDIRKVLNDKPGIARNLNIFGKIEEDSGNLPEACMLYKESLEILQLEGAPDAEIALANLREAQKKMNV
jgi:tetratricopeptide (TPR) repeat protein